MQIVRVSTVSENMKKVYATIKADILSNGKAEIVRNNVYKLKVTGIAKLGLPEPKDEPKLATLKLSVEVEPWTIQTNNFEFK